MSEHSSISEKNETSARTARSVAAILSQTSTDEALRALNQSDGRNQSEQASFLAAESPFLRDIYERGATVVDGVLTVPKENLTQPPEIEITTQRAAVERLTRITNDAAVARELAPQFVAHGERIAGSHADGATSLKVFGWLYRTLEGKQELLEPEKTETSERDVRSNTEASFSEKWQQIVELSEALAELEPKDRLPENSLEALGENIQENETTIERDENSSAEIYEAADKSEDAEQRTEEIVSGGGLVGFERIEIGSDLPKIPENLSRSDFEKLLEKTGAIDSQLERGVAGREVLAPFKRYVELTKLDNELRLVEEEYAKQQAKIIGGEQGAPQNYRFAAKREEMRELDEDRATLVALRVQKAKLTETIQTDFGDEIDRAKVQQSINGRNGASETDNKNGAAKPQNIELSEDEAELRRVLIKEKSVEREINELDESISAREKSFRLVAELSGDQIPAERRKELFEKVVSLELPASGVLKDRYPELTASERREKLTEANTFEIRNPAEYLYLREAASRQFQMLRTLEIKKEYRRFETAKLGEKTDARLAKREAEKHREKIQQLKTIEPAFAYKIEGGNRIINAKPSERAVSGYEFAAAYVRYQLKQPEVRLRHESIVYREYAARLDAAKTPSDVMREAYKIRQENHRAAGAWRNSEKEELRDLTRPLSKNEMTLLFLEPPPKNYTAEMSILKYNFAHYAKAKARMTAALEDGNLQPGAEAEKLARSLEGRLARRELETKHKATKHFFESLKIENEKLVIKNEFDHADVYQNLPPHEKDWIYNRATTQRENLEYKMAYERGTGANRNIGSQQSQPVPRGEAAISLRHEFAAGTLWHQAAILANRKDAEDFERDAAKTDEKLLKTVGFLIHNQSEANNLRVSDWLERQKSEELKTAGEILNTFARATRDIQNNQLTVTVKIAETNRVSAEDYKKLFERYFPADFERSKEFRAKDNEKFRLEQSRRMGQSAMLDAWAENTEKAIYQTDAPVKVFENERRELQEIERIKAAQIECRRAVEIKNAIALKYEEKIKKEFAKNNQAIAGNDLRAAVERAFMPEKSDAMTAKQKAIFERLHDKISLSDFERFAESTKRLEKGIADITQSFEKIAALRLENAEYTVAPEKIKSTDSLQKQYETAQRQAETEQITLFARAKFTSKTVDNAQTLADSVTNEEREQARIESHKRARIALEPAELSEPEQGSEIEAKALEFADALHTAHQASLNRQSESEIATAFNTAETKRDQFREFLKFEKESHLSPGHKPATLEIYERELVRNERNITRAKISQMIETGELSLADLETKKASEIFSPKERDEIKLEAGERTRENLEPKELWAQRGDVSEKLQQAALSASDALERAHEIYHEPDANKQEISRAFSALDEGIVRLKKERRTDRNAAKFINFKTEFKRDLAQMFGRWQTLDDSRMLAAMTKGLLIDGLEKQNIQPEKIGVSSEKLSEISRTITMAMVDDKKRQKTIAFNSKPVAPVQDSRAAEMQTNTEKHNAPIKMRQIEHSR